MSKPTFRIEYGIALLQQKKVLALIFQRLLEDITLKYVFAIFILVFKQ